LSKLDNIINNTSGQFASLIEQIQSRLVSEIFDLKKTGRSTDDIILILNSIDMEDYILGELRLSNNIDELALAYGKVLENIMGFGAISEEALQALVDIEKSYILGQSKNFANTLKQQLTRGVVANVSEKELVENLLNGTGGLLRPDQAETLINTSLNSYSRNVTQIMAESMPSDTKYYYEGVADDKTRDICLEMISAGELTKEEIDSQFPYTFTDGGGFNCRHRWTMVTTETKTIDKKAKNIINNKKSYNPVTARGVKV